MAYNPTARYFEGPLPTTPNKNLVFKSMFSGPVYSATGTGRFTRRDFRLTPGLYSGFFPGLGIIPGNLVPQTYTQPLVRR